MSVPPRPGGWLTLVAAAVTLIGALALALGNVGPGAVLLLAGGAGLIWLLRRYGGAERVSMSEQRSAIQVRPVVPPIDPETRQRVADELAELEAEVARRRSIAAQRASNVDPASLQPLATSAGLDGMVEQLRRAEAETAAAASRAGGRGGRPGQDADQRGPKREEALAAAQAEMARVQTLDETLTETLRFLDAAQQRVHRDIAPVLANSVRRWLPRVTSGRYADVRVDPQTLKVSVLGPDGRWRDAALLSRGTAEQIYLLLRVALAEHLTRDDEICPPILDDVTVQCDDERTEGGAPDAAGDQRAAAGDSV